VKHYLSRKPLEPVLSRFGALRAEGGTFIVSGIDRESVPDLVQALTEAGARIFAIEPLSGTLEERFLQIAGGAQE